MKMLFTQAVEIGIVVNDNVGCNNANSEDSVDKMIIYDDALWPRSLVGVAKGARPADLMTAKSERRTRNERKTRQRTLRVLWNSLSPKWNTTCLFPLWARTLTSEVRCLQEPRFLACKPLRARLTSAPCAASTWPTLTICIHDQASRLVSLRRAGRRLVHLWKSLVMTPVALTSLRKSLNVALNVTSNCRSVTLVRRRRWRFLAGGHFEQLSQRLFLVLGRDFLARRLEGGQLQCAVGATNVFGALRFRFGAASIGQ